MKFKTFGNRNDPAVLFFHAMGVTGESSEPVAQYLQDRYIWILPTCTVFWKGEEYVLTPEELVEFHRDANKLMEKSEQQEEVAVRG